MGCSFVVVDGHDVVVVSVVALTLALSQREREQTVMASRVLST